VAVTGSTHFLYAKAPVTREARVETSRDNIYNLLNEAQREFVSYVLRNYVTVGVETGHQQAEYSVHR
jgi:type I restriction enzyme R subunit